MYIVNKSQVHLVDGQPKFLAEASDLGFAPGEWPDYLAVVQQDGDGGRTGMLFEKVRQIQGGGWLYQSRDGRFTLEVLND